MTTQAPIRTSFSATSTAAEVIEGVDLTGRRAVVTGGASGIGVETARALAGAGAEVTLAVRKLDEGRQVAADIEASTGRAVGFAYLDLADQASVRTFVDNWQGRLDILVNNAGVMASPETRTPEGWELQFATNHLGHFALATGLLGPLAASGGARIVSVSSVGHLNSPVVFDDVHFEHRDYDPWAAYGQSKTANVLFAVEASKRWESAGIVANALHPGAIRTNLQRHVTDEELNRLRAATGAAEFVWKTPEQGAATSILVATSPLLAGVGGRYFEDCNQADPHVPGTRRGVADYALDPEAAERLWDLSEKTLAG